MNELNFTNLKEPLNMVYNKPNLYPSIYKIICDIKKNPIQSEWYNILFIDDIKIELSLLEKFQREIDQKLKEIFRNLILNILKEFEYINTMLLKDKIIKNFIIFYEILSSEFFEKHINLINLNKYNMASIFIIYYEIHNKLWDNKKDDNMRYYPDEKFFMLYQDIIRSCYTLENEKVYFLLKSDDTCQNIILTKTNMQPKYINICPWEEVIKKDKDKISSQFRNYYLKTKCDDDNDKTSSEFIFCYAKTKCV